MTQAAQWSRGEQGATTPARLAPAEAGELVGRAAQGDTEAWEELVRAYVGLVWAVARNHYLRPDDAADVVQVTWLRLVEHVDRLHDPERVGAWLATTARHEAIRVRRRAQRELAVPDLPAVAEALSREVSDGDDVSPEVLHEVTDAFLALPARSRDLMRLLLLDPAPSYTEIASALDMPVGSIGPTRGRCLKAMRERLGRTSLTQRATPGTG